MTKDNEIFPQMPKWLFDFEWKHLSSFCCAPCFLFIFGFVLFCFRSSMEQWRWPGFWSQADWADHVISPSCSLFVNMRYLYLSYIKSRWFWILMIVKRREDSEAGNQTHTLSKPSRRRWWAVRLRHLFDFYVLLFPGASVTSFSLDRYGW